MPEKMITSTSNSLVKRLRALMRDRAERESEGRFVCEGIQPVWRAVDAGACIEMLVVAPGLLGGSPGERLLGDAEAAGVPRVLVSDAVFRRVSDREGPSGVAAVVDRSPGRLEQLPVTGASLFVVLHETANPGNLGSIIRTADAAGADGVVLLGRCADPYSPASVKASMGSLFSVPLVLDASLDSFFAWACEHDVSTMTTSARAKVPYDTSPYPTPLAVVLGSEGSGLPAGLLARGDSQVTIPMFGTASSLNLSVAAGVLLFEARRQIGAPHRRRPVPSNEPGVAGR